MTCFVIEQVRNHQETNDETNISECLKCSETLFQMLISMPRTAFEIVIFLVKLIFYKINSLQKKQSKRISLHQEITLKHFVISAMKCFNAEMFCFKLKSFVSNRVAVTWFECKELMI